MSTAINITNKTLLVSQCYNTRILNTKLSLYYFSYLLFNLRFYKRPIKDLLQTIRLFISEWDGRRDCIQTTAEHDVVWSIWAGDHAVVNYPVHTWIENTQNSSFMRNLTSWSVLSWLVLLTEHEVLHCYAPNAVCRCLVDGHCIPVLRILLSKLSMLPCSQYQPLSANSVNTQNIWRGQIYFGTQCSFSDTLRCLHFYEIILLAFIQ